MSLSVVSDSFQTPQTIAQLAPLSMGFSRQEYWSGWPFPSAGDLPDPGSEPGFPAFQAESLPSEPPGKPRGDGNQRKPEERTTPTRGRQVGRRGRLRAGEALRETPEFLGLSIRWLQERKAGRWEKQEQLILRETDE